MKSTGKQLLLIGLIGLGTLIYAFDLQSYLTLDYIKSQQDKFSQFYIENPIVTIAIYMAIYIATTALSLPGAALLTLLGGALFGVVTGTIVVSFASTIGATLAFLAARFLVRDWVQSEFKKYLEPINKGFDEEGSFYLFTMRLIPAIPFFVINLVTALTPMKTWNFYWVSQIGMLAGTIVYVNAGTQLSKIESASGLLSPTLFVSFVALGFFPLVAKKLMEKFKSKRTA